MNEVLRVIDLNTDKGLESTRKKEVRRFIDFPVGNGIVRLDFDHRTPEGNTARTFIARTKPA